MRTDSKQAVSDALTPREMDILRLLADGLSNRQIAYTLSFSLNTVKWYINQIYSKLGVGSRTQALAEANKRHLLDNESASVATFDSNLPVYTTPLIGRTDELARIAALLHNSRLITLVGPGGIGKTRLALEAAAQASGNFEHGAHLVSLAPIASSDQIVPAIADAVGFQFPPGDEPYHSLLRYLKPKQMLLVLDNFEHLLDGADIVTDILAAATRVSILATAREPLSLQPETVFTVGGLPVSTSGETTDAMALFLDYAGRAKAGFEFQSDDFEKLLHICRALDGMPLALILAAGWLKTQTLDEIAAEIGRSLDLLEAEWRDLPERQRSMRAVFDHSWRLLTPKEQQVFRRLSVFRGGFTRAAAEAVAGANLRILASLVNKSLLRRDPSTGRYDLHELLRQYSEEQLKSAEETSQTQQAHAVYFAQFAATESKNLKGGRQREALNQIEADVDNIREAFYRTVQEYAFDLIEQFTDMWLFFDMRGRWYEGKQFFGQAVNHLGHLENRAIGKMLSSYGLLLARLSLTENRSIGILLSGDGMFVSRLAQANEVLKILDESIRLLRQYGEPKDILIQSLLQGTVLKMLGEDEQSHQSYIEADQLVQRYGDSWDQNASWYLLGVDAIYQQDFDRARELFLSSYAICRAEGLYWGITFLLESMGFMAEIDHDYEQAERLYRELLQVAEENGYRSMLGRSYETLSRLAWQRGEILSARELLEKSLIVYGSMGRLTPWCEAELGKIVAQLNDFQTAKPYFHKAVESAQALHSIAELLHVALVLAETLAQGGAKEQAVELVSLYQHNPLRVAINTETDRSDRLIAQLRQELPSDDFAAACERGKTASAELLLRQILKDD